MLSSLVESMSLLQVFGLAVLCVGIVGMFFSPYRYLLTYLAAGMGYWVTIESFSYFLQQNQFSASNAYISAIGMSMVMVFAWIVYTEPKRQRVRAANKKANYIEHTPLYDGEVPTSKG